MGNYSKYPNAAGIYKLTCLHNGKVYIGKSVNLRKRLSEHKSCEKKLKGRCHLQHAIIKYGWKSFEVEILEIFENFNKSKDNVMLLEREAHYIELFSSTDGEVGYNKCKYSIDSTGISLSEEHKKKIGESNLGKKHSEESKEKMRNPKSEEHKEKLRKPKKDSSNMRKPKSEEHKAKLRKPFSEERKANLRKPKSEEHKEKLRKPKRDTSKMGRPKKLKEEKI